MSVLVLDLEVYEAIFEKAWKYGFNNQVDINYCNELSFNNEDELKNHIKNWLTLNELSFIRRYNEDDKPNLSEFLTFRKHHNINTYQMLKYLQCIQYNIELDTIKRGRTAGDEPMVISPELMRSYELLEAARLEIMQRIIAEIPKYKNANWSII